MISTVSFRVAGVPGPQGSKTVSRHGRVFESSAKVGPWRAAVHDAAHAELMAGRWGETFHTGPLELDVTFHYAMPKKRTAAQRAAGMLWRHVTPDLDKLVRSTGDALTSSQLIKDDGQFALIVARKVETNGGWSGAEIRISQLPGGPET